MRTYDTELFKKNGIHKKWVQESHSYSREKYTVRGFHFQYPPFVETKLIRVTAGKILFTILDLRPDSKSFGQWVQVIVSAKKNNMLYIPQGCAPCMCTLTKNCHLLYKMDSPFAPENYDNILWNDPELNIPWPIKKPLEISEKDAKAQTFREFAKKSGGLKP